MIKLPGLVFVMTLVASNSLHASAPAFVGTWGNDAAQCAVPQELQGAPMVISASGYDQHEAHCKFSNLKGNGPTWTLKALCSVEGDQQIEELTLTVKGNTLTITDDYGSRDLMKCE